MTLFHGMRNLSVDEQAILAMAGVYIVWLLADLFTADRQPVRRQYDPTEKAHWLDYRDIDRLQNGHAVSLGEWDGHELLLQGEVVIDVEGETDG